ncbi:MAG: Gfo/Idh/MocA family protein [Acidimicrobiia bacterium]
MTVRVGIIGVGWGSIVHLPAYRAADGYEVVALCSQRRESVEAAGAKNGITDTSTDWESFVRRDDLDLVSIAAPVAHHHPMTMAALAADKHVLCEKPLALTAAQCAEMVAAAETSGKATATCFELRWLPDRSRVRQLVADGVVGTPYFVRLSQSAGYWHPTHAAQAPWMYDLAAGGGYLNGLLAHDIDLICSLFGRPVSLCAEVRTSVPTKTLRDGTTIDVTADDTSALLLRLESGALAVITASVVGVHTSGAHLDVFGKNGSIVGPLGSRPSGTDQLKAGTATDSGLATVEPLFRMPTHDDVIPQRGAGGMIRAMALMLEDWHPSLVDRAVPTTAPSLRDGMIVQQVIEAARASAAGRGWIDL